MFLFIKEYTDSTRNFLWEFENKDDLLKEWFEWFLDCCCYDLFSHLSDDECNKFDELFLQYCDNCLNFRLDLSPKEILEVYHKIKENYPDFTDQLLETKDL